MAAVRGANSPIRWAGSKRKLIPYLSRFLDHGCVRLLEPFCGSASFYFASQVTVGLLNDVNKGLINAFRAIATNPVYVHESLLALPVSSDQYYAIRSEQNLDRGDEAAVRFLYLNRFCFNGIYRTNRDGRFNVPYAASGTGGFPTIERWMAFAARLKSARLSSMDFQDFCASEVRAGDLVLLDPPYFCRSRRIFSEYSASDFDEAAQRRLLSTLDLIVERDARFVLTYEKSPESALLARGWFSTCKAVSRTVAGNASSRGIVEEVFVSNDRNAIRRIARMA